MKGLIDKMKEIFLYRISQIIKNKNLSEFDKFEYRVRKNIIEKNTEFDTIEYISETTVDNEFYKSFFLIDNKNKKELEEILEYIEKEYICNRNNDIKQKLVELEETKQRIIKEDLKRGDNLKFNRDFIISFIEAIDIVKKGVYIMQD